MQNLRDRFNRQARRKRDFDHLIFWLIVLFLLEQRRKLERDAAYSFTPRPPGFG